MPRESAVNPRGAASAPHRLGRDLVSWPLPFACALDLRTLLMMPFAFLQNVGTTELLIVAFVSLLVFGNRLPSVMRSLGKSVTEFKKGVSGIEDEIDQAVTADKKTTPPNP